MQHNISRDTSQEYFNIQPRTKRHTRHKISRVNPQPRFRTPISSLNNKCVFIYSCRKVRRITYKLKSISRRYGILILIQSIMHILLKDKSNTYDTHQENRTNYNNSIITIQRLHFRKSSFQEYPNTTQSSNTFQ